MAYLDFSGLSRFWSNAKTHINAKNIVIRDGLRAEVEAVSGGRNTVVRDSDGNPHIMCVIPRFRLEDIDASLGSGNHPAFIVGSTVKSELLIGKYEASKSGQNKVQSLPGKAPWVSINHDNAVAACKAMGTGFHAFTNAEWAAVALWNWKHQPEGHVYYGNTNWGRHHEKKYQTGVMQTPAFLPGDSGNNVSGATLTGTGPDEWNIDGTPWGISDMVGNVHEWTPGIRVNNGEIQVIPNNDAALADTDLSASSTAWKAILEDGSLVAPGTAGTLKFDSAYADRSSWGNAGLPSINTVITNSVSVGYNGGNFKALEAVSGVTIPAILKQLALFPIGNDVQGNMWIRNNGERLCSRGASWVDGASCGPFAVNLANMRTHTYWGLGFRPALLS